MSEAAIRSFVESDYPRVVTGLALMTGSRTLAEDAVNEAMARAWERLDRGRSIDSVPAWITTVSMNLTRSGLRRARVERRAKAYLEASAATQPETNADRVDVERALSALPRRQREATILRYYLDLRVEDVAKAMGISEGTAKSTLAKARVKLAEQLDVAEEAEEHV